MPNCKKCQKEIPEESIFCMWCGAKQKRTPRKTLKRENHTGSVYKRSDLKGRPWVAATPAEKGKRPEIIGYYETAQQAKDALDEYRKNPTDKLNITVKELYEEWKQIGYKDKSQQLCNGYNFAWSKLTDIYGIKFRELRTAQMQNIIESLLNSESKKPLAPSSVSIIKVLLGLLYRYAMQNDIVNKNYAQFIVLPKKEASVKECFSEIEVKKIENSVGKVPFADCVLFLCYTGLRINEFLSLNKMSVHDKNGVCALVGGIKTTAGKNRIVPVHHKIKIILDDWLNKDGEVIFCRPDKKKYDPSRFREQCYYPALEAMGIRKLSPHAARRTFATMMSRANIREEDFIAMMGHSEYSVDIENYIFQSAEKLQKSIEKIP